MADIAIEREQCLAKLVLRRKARINQRAGLLDKPLPIACNRAESELSIIMEEVLHYVPAPPVNRMGIGCDNIANFLAVLDPDTHASNSTITLPMLPPVKSFS